MRYAFYVGYTGCGGMRCAFPPYTGCARWHSSRKVWLDPEE